MTNSVRRTTLACVLVLLVSAAHARGGDRLGSHASQVTMIGLRVGDRIAQRAYQLDQIEWKLPKKRLEHFRQAGVIITEERHITSDATATVSFVGHSGSLLDVHEHVRSFDVPRKQLTETDESSVVRLAADNPPLLSVRLSVAEAAMVGLPVTPWQPGRVGQQWRTHLAVLTALGSGDISFRHTITSFENGRAHVAVQGTGEITGTEYHLPKLLPGSIELEGSAWYDPRSGVVTQESYSIRNQLLKPAEGEHIGFDERLTVDASTRLIRGQRRLF